MLCKELSKTIKPSRFKAGFSFLEAGISGIGLLSEEVVDYLKDVVLGEGMGAVIEGDYQTFAGV